MFFNKEIYMNSLCRNNISQMVEALTCPVNRHAVRVKYGWNDHDLFRNPDTLVEHYILNGGAKKHAELRKEAENGMRDNSGK
jgi:hypothetical protein